MTAHHTGTTAGNQPTSGDQADRGGWTPRPFVCLLLAVVGGAMAWGVLQCTSPIFTVPKQYHIPNIGAAPEKWEAFEAVQTKVNRINAMVELSWFGALVAGMIALAQSIGRRSLKPLLVAVPVGAAGGCAAGFIGSLAHEALGIGALADMGQTVKAQAVMLGVLGAGVGLALGVSGRSPRRIVVSCVAGMLAGILASLLYPVAISFLLPAESTGSLVPKGAANRLLWTGMCAALLGLIIAATGRPRRAPTYREKHSPEMDEAKS